jgi:hypothetical protein
MLLVRGVRKWSKNWAMTKNGRLMRSVQFQKAGLDILFVVLSRVIIEIKIISRVIIER